MRWTKGSAVARTGETNVHPPEPEREFDAGRIDVDAHGFHPYGTWRPSRHRRSSRGPLAATGKRSSAVRALIQAGRIDEGAELANQAAGDLADPLAVAQLRIMLSTIGLMRCRWEEATSHAGAVLSEPGLAEHLYAEAKLAQLRSFMSEGNEIGMRSLVASIMGGDNRLGETAALGAALVVSAKWAWDGWSSC